MALGPATVATSIAALSVSGVTMVDLTGIKQTYEARDCPVFFPDPTQFVTDFEMQVDSFGSASAKKTARYTLHYVFLYTEAGAGRGIYDHAQGIIQKVSLILDAFASNDALTGCIDDTITGLTVATITDPAGKQFYGALIPIRVMEFIN